jgi:hypothetical protein
MLLAAASLALAAPSPFKKSLGEIHVAVFGDAPYGTTPTDTAEFQASPAFIQSINADPDVSLVLHVGDIHSGKQFCTQAYDQSIYQLWKMFQHPLVYTPGDNEWTDCHKSGEGGGTYNPVTMQIDFLRDAHGNLIDYQGGNPVANLALVRSIFFAKPGRTLGTYKVVLSQSQAFDQSHPSDANYVENVMWEQSGVLFVTVNIPGGSNNDKDIWYGAPTTSPEQAQEKADRTGADIRWLDAAFARATADHMRAVVIETQADMWDLDGKTPSHLTEYEGIISDIATNVTAFGKPVLLFNGDSHIYRSDNPMVQGAACVAEPSSGQPAVACADDDWTHHTSLNLNVPNFHRVVVHGSTFPLEWLDLDINPRANAPASANAFGPFSWTRMIQH